MQKLGELKDLPSENKKKVGAKVKYPYATMKPGQWFQYPTTIKPTSAKVMASQNANAFGMRLRVFRGVDGLIYCQRIDGLKIREKDLPVNSKELPDAIGSENPRTVPKPMFKDEVFVTNDKISSDEWEPTV